MMKVWNMVLVSATFFLCIFGTFLTRSGVVQLGARVRASPRSANTSSGSWRSASPATIYLILSRLDYLKSEAQLESVLSRESSFMFNNLILLASCFAVLWGTLFPVISEAVTGEKISVDTPFFNRVNIPIGMFLLLLTGVGPLIAWRRSSFESLRRTFRGRWRARWCSWRRCSPAGMRHFYALMSLRAVPVRDVDDRDRVLQGRARDPRQERDRTCCARDGRADASQHAALRRLPGAHGHRAHVHRLHRRGVQQGHDGGSEAGRDASRWGTTSCTSRTSLPARTTTLRWTRALIDVSKNGDCAGHAGAGAPLLQGQQPADVGGRDPPPAERRPVPQLRRSLGTTTSGR